MTTADATGIGQTGATLSASYTGASETPREVGFEWGTSADNLNNELYVDMGSGTSGSFSVEITGLSTSTTYYYRAYILVGTDKYYFGGIKSFTTKSESTTDDLGYLVCLEVPAVSISGKMASGSEEKGRGYMWYRYLTTDTNRAVATHTYSYNGRVVRNYTVMLDGSKKAPVWTAHAMHNSIWPDNNVGRNDNWVDDPAFTGLGNWQQDGVNGYSKGHLVASNYRQTSKEQNAQTFYLSNQAPQLQNGFNDSIWNELEQAVKASSPTGSDTLYVVTGVLYEGTPQYSDGIQIPSHFYKCLMKCSFSSPGIVSGAQGCAYVFTNTKHSNSNYSTGLVTIDSIETRAGFDFFPRVPEEYQEKAENGTSVFIL